MDPLCMDACNKTCKCTHCILNWHVLLSLYDGGLLGRVQTWLGRRVLVEDLESQHIHSSLHIVAHHAECWCLKTKNIVSKHGSRLHRTSSRCGRLNSNSEQKPKARWGHCGLSGC